MFLLLLHGDGWDEFALLGVAWAIIFYRWFRDRPHEHPKVNEAERQLLEDNVKLDSREAPIPWRLFLSSSRGSIPTGSSSSME